MKTSCATFGTLEPVTLSETKEFLRVASGTIEDARIMTMIRAARRAVEEFGRFAVVRREWVTVYRTPEFRSFGVDYQGSWHDPDNIRQNVYLPRRPVKALTSIALNYTDGTTADLATLVNLNLLTGRVHWNSGSFDRSIAAKEGAALAVTYEAGFDPLPNGEDPPARTDAPEEIRLAVLQTVQHYYESRELGTSKAIPPIARQHLQGWFQSASVS